MPAGLKLISMTFNRPYCTKSGVKNKIAVIACGNVLKGDDGAGPAVLEILRPRMKEADLIDAGTSGELPTFLKRYEKVVIVDAGFFPGNKPFARLGQRDRLLKGEEGTHTLGIAESLELAKKLKLKLPEKIEIFLIRPKNLGFGEELSEEVRGVLPEVAGEIEKILAEWSRA